MNAVYGLPKEGVREEDSIHGVSNSCYSIPMAEKINNGARNRSTSKRYLAEQERLGQNSYQMQEDAKQSRFELFRSSLEQSQNSRIFFREASGSRYPSTTCAENTT